jgi:hypothetical protein
MVRTSLHQTNLFTSSPADEKRAAEAAGGKKK